MSIQPFRLAFDLMTSPDDWPGVVVPMGLLILVGFMLLLVPGTFLQRVGWPKQSLILAKLLGAAFVLFAGPTSIQWAVSHANQLNALKTLEREGRLSFVEGCLQGYHPMPVGGHEYERIAVAGKQFAYSDFDETSPKFHNAASHGGPIHADSAVKIWYAGSSIVRLMVSDHACTPAPDILMSSTNGA